MKHLEESEVKDEDNKGSEVDYWSIFPESKIKALVKRDEGIGRISSKAVSLIGEKRSPTAAVRAMLACASTLIRCHGALTGAYSAVFMRKLVEASAEISDPNVALTASKDAGRKRIAISLQNIRKCVLNQDAYDFLADVLQDFEEQNCPKCTQHQPKRRKSPAATDRQEKEAASDNCQVEKDTKGLNRLLDGGVLRKVVHNANVSKQDTTLLMDEENYD